MDLLGFEVEAQTPTTDDLAHEAGRWFADLFGVVPRLTAFVPGADPARLVGPAGLTVDLATPEPAGHYDAQITEFIDSAAELDGPPTAELAAAIEAIVADASQAIGIRLDGVAHNKVLATHLLLSQQARGDAPAGPTYWHRSAASTLLSWFVGRGAPS